MGTQYVLPLFDEKNSFMGVWCAMEEFGRFLSEEGELRRTTLLFHLAQLGELMEPTIRAFSESRKLRVISNSNLDIGNKVSLEGGIFVMMYDDRAPVEELSRPDSSVAYKVTRFDFDGRKSCQVLVRVKRADPSIHAPPRGGYLSPGRARRKRAKRPSRRRWIKRNGGRKYSTGRRSDFIGFRVRVDLVAA